MNYLINVLASLSVMLNALTGGSYRNTFSARVGHAVINGKRWARIIEKMIDLMFGQNHCFNEYVNEKETFK